MNRLNNAVAQRNAAREEVLMLDAKLKQLQEDMEAGRLRPVVPGAAAATPPAPTPGREEGLHAAEEGGVFASMRRYMSSIPGPSPQRENGSLAATPATVGRSFDTPGSKAMSEMDRRQHELYQRQQQLLREQRTADQERLITAISENLGFHSGRPVAAVTIFRCCLQWKTFQADRGPLFDRIMATVGSQVELHQEDNTHLAYWLSNTVTLFYLLQKNIKPASGGGYAARLRQQGQQVTRGLFGSSKGGGLSSFFSRSGYGGSPGGEASIHGGAAGGFRQVGHLACSTAVLAHLNCHSGSRAANPWHPQPSVDHQ